MMSGSEVDLDFSSTVLFDLYSRAEKLEMGLTRVLHAFLTLTLRCVTFPDTAGETIAIKRDSRTITFALGVNLDKMRTQCIYIGVKYMFLRSGMFFVSSMLGFLTRISLGVKQQHLKSR